jgi:hypothetical protein
MKIFIVLFTDCAGYRSIVTPCTSILCFFVANYDILSLSLHKFGVVNGFGIVIATAYNQTEINL